MAIQFEETQDLIPETPAKILLVCLAATLVFMVACYIAGIIEELWQPALFAVITALAAVIILFVKLRIKVDEENITVGFVKMYTVPLAHVIDVKKGDIDVARNYSGWGIKKVKFRNYTTNGIDGAVTVKLAGRNVLTMTCKDPDTLYDILYRYRRQD